MQIQRMIAKISDLIYSELPKSTVQRGVSIPTLIFIIIVALVWQLSCEGRAIKIFFHV